MEAIVQFGPAGQLLGLLAGNPAAAPATLVLLNAGTFPRSGPFRMNVELARELAAKGYAVFRFDLPGVGESPRLSNLSPVEAVSASLDCLSRDHGGRHFVVGGICSAADLGWRVAEGDRRVCGVLLLDGISFAGPWFALARIRRLLARSPRHWPAMARRLRDQLAATDRAPTSADFRDWPTRREAREQMQAMLARGVRFLFIYTGGVRDRLLDLRQFDWAFGDAARSEQVTVQRWPDCDHLFYRQGDRQRLLDTLADWLPGA
jgi:alpha-beta hydrolase superfamily lysophospholipase